MKSGWNIQEIMVANNLDNANINYNSFLSRATGIPSNSRYLATVLLDIEYPFSLRIIINLSSFNGIFLSSASIQSIKIFFTSRLLTSSPLSLVMDSEKKLLIKKVPKGV